MRAARFDARRSARPNRFNQATAWQQSPELQKFTPPI